ncbi:sulfatase family protein [Echinimonas agarilytica]|uniref:Sulfatase-like hydrolase/transferase n=1 Tax=Echinimonas agarilytica TaxID=1215918 RepID=A0AA42B698_9GAMM|nr:sulfatase-like hydrolase/transferase [Echinimonas agarilytica]MCM2678520.1 sulfatase-like hydrolase/transferase [Echinimonas agarilytica]
MNKKMFKKLGALCLMSASAFSVTAAERPNILWILVDDMGYGDVGFNGSTDIRTPNLDTLAQQGMTFDAAYNVHPFCGPSRAGLMTGRYPHMFGSQFNLPTSDISGGLGIDSNETFISKTLQNSGYYTGVVGKWHLGETAEFHPHQRGFDEFYGFLNGGHSYFPEKFKPQYEKQREQGLNLAIFPYLKPLEHNGKEVDEKEYITDGLSREAVNFIEKAADKKDQPFFLYLAYNAPHSPMEAKQEDMDQFPDIQDEKRKIYAGMVYAIDRGVKRIVESLKATDQFDNTLIVFWSDNGGRPPLGASNHPLRGRKGSALEGGTRTPMLFHWPEKIKGGQHFKHPVSTLDFYPTFAGLAGAEVPKDKKLDGVDIWPSLKSNTTPRKGKMLYVMRHRYGFSEVSARRDNWKAVNIEGKRWELYDIEKDIGETTDLSAKYPNVLREMVAEMEIWSWQHTQPEWFHIHAEGVQWREKSMPRFHETFTLKNQ